MIANLNRCGVQLMSQPFLQILKLPYPSPAFAPKMQSYTILRERRGPEELQRLLPEDMFLRLESAVLEVSSGSCLDSGHWLLYRWFTADILFAFIPSTSRDNEC